MSTMARTKQHTDTTWLTLISRKGSEIFKEGRERKEEVGRVLWRCKRKEERGQARNLGL